MADRAGLRVDRRDLAQGVGRAARASVASIPARVSSPPPRVRKSESAGPGQTSASRQLGFSPLKPLARSTRCLKSAIQRDRRRVGEVGGFDADVELAGDAGGVLQLVRGRWTAREALRGERADVGDGLDLGAEAPAEDRQGEADAEDSLGGAMRARDRRRSGGRVLSPGGSPAGGGCASVLGPPPVPPAEERLPLGRAEGQGGEACGEGEEEGDGDADDQQQAEAADHRGRGELEGEEAGGGGEAGGGDGGAAGGGGGARRVDCPRWPRLQTASSKRAWNWIA